MKVASIKTNIYKNRYLKKGLEFVSDNGALFNAGASLVFSTICRPISIWMAPKTDKENKKLACAKSISSSLVGFGLMAGVSLPVSNSIKKIDSTPEKYLKKETILSLKEGSQKLTSSKSYRFATQLFKLGIGAAVSVPKSIITCALIPPIVGLIFKNKNNIIKSNKNSDSNKNSTINNKQLTFKGRIKSEPLTKTIAGIINNRQIQEFSNKYKNSNYPMHITAITDVVSTAAFATQTKLNKKIKEERKNPLIFNSIISTGLSVISGYGVNKLLEKPTEKFIHNFKEANKNSKKINKYIDGIKIAKPALILGTMYYCIIPLASTFFADRIPSGNKK